MNKEKYKQAIKDFRLMDDTFMSAVFDGNIEGTQLVLNIILNRSDMVVTEVVAQREYKNLIDRSIRLDIYAKDSSGKEYDIEVQRAKDGSECRRARYHSSMMDTKMLKKKQKFSEIKDSYVIFITETDALGMGLPIYHIERTVLEMQTLFGDGSHIIYVNGSYEDGKSPLGKLIHDFKCKEPGEMNYSVLAEKVDFLKNDERGNDAVCEIMDKLNKEATEEAIYERNREVALKLLEIGKLSYEEIAQSSDLSVEEVKALAEGKTA